MKTLDKILIYLTGTFCFLCIAVIVAAIAFPDFRDNGGSFVVIVLGALTTFAGSILTGSYFARDVKNAPREELEAEKKEEEEAGVG